MEKKSNELPLEYTTNNNESISIEKKEPDDLGFEKQNF